MTLSKDSVYLTAEEFDFDNKYWIIFGEPQPDGGTYVHHAVSFDEEPDENNIKHVYEEVRTDPEFGIGDLVDSLTVTLLKPGPEADEFAAFLKSETDEDDEEGDFHISQPQPHH